MVTVRGISENLLSNAIWAVLALLFTGLTVLLASLTPFLRELGPFSYLVASLIALLLAAMIIYFVIRAWRHFRPAPKLADRLTPDHAPVVGDISGIEFELAGLGDRIAGLNSTCNDRIAAIEAVIAKRKEPGPGDYLIYERWLDIQEKRVESLVDDLRKWEQHPQSVGSRTQIIANIGKQINEITGKLFGKAYEFTGKAQFEDNPYRPVPGEEEISGDERRFEFRKKYWDDMQMKHALDQIEADFRGERSRVKNASIRFGRELEGKIK